MEKKVSDPRGFMLWQDSVLWVKLLQLAWDQEKEQDKPGLYGGLYLMRCNGTRLEASSKFSYRLVPTIDPSGNSGYTSKDEYRADARELLDPYQKQLITLLKELEAQ